MRLYLLGKQNLEYVSLPEKSDDGVTITKIFNNMDDYPLYIEYKDEKWCLKSSDRLQVIKDKMFTDRLAINPFQYYVINIVGTDKSLLLYSLPTFDPNTYNLKVEKDSITIGDNGTNDVYFNQAAITINKVTNQNNTTSYQLTNNSQNFKVYINGVNQQQAILKTGDIIFCNGLKIIWMNNFFNINNPNGGVHVPSLNPYKNDVVNTNYKVNDDDINIQLYDEKDYFYHTLRMDNDCKYENVDIEIISIPKSDDDLSFILGIGSSITMAASSLMTGFTIVINLQSGNKSITSMIPQIVMFFSMLLGSLLIPKIVNRYQRNKAKKIRKQKVEKYNQYLKEKETKIETLKKQQEQLLRDNNPNAYDCYQMLFATEKVNNVNFWNRQIKDKDFLTVRLGIGSCDSFITTKLPEKKFTLDEDEFMEKIYAIGEKAKKLNNIPITLSLVKNNVTGIIINNNAQQQYLNNIIMQLVTLHSSMDLKIVVLTNEKNADKWNYIKYLPHCLSDDKEIRFFARNQDEINEISSYLEKEYKSRKTNQPTNPQEEKVAVEEEYQKSQSYKNYETYYLIINDDYASSKNSIIVDSLVKTSINFGFSYLCVGNKIKELPNKCSAFIEVLDKNGTIIENDEKTDTKETTKFEIEQIPTLDMRKVANKLANIPMVTKDGLSVLPNTLNFLEMLKVSKIEQLDIASRWKNNNPVTSLAATVGVHTNGDDFKLDLHEKFHGPHGLIAGSTGSGKSEFIITYILSMAVNYHPYEVQFVLIDYKGGGLAGAFENKETGVKIPHLIGTITNLDTAEMNRTLVSIESELKRRQRIFNEVRDQLGEGTIDIYKYQRLYREGAVSEPMAHLFIISDEFAELKAQQPDFMQQLISTARIGRSLGVHLILATQKPSGVVNDQIWSNSKFKVCLKVQDRSDSMEMLKRPEAASIKEAGRFYLQVGYNDYFDIGQSGWSGAKYIPSDRIIKKIDDSIMFIDDVGYSVKTIKDITKVDTSQNLGEQLTNVVKYIYNLSVKENIKTNKLWLDALKPEIYLSELKAKYSYKPQSYFINPVIGEYDNPSSQEQGLLNLNISSGNTLIYGQTGSGKEQLLSTTIWSTMAEHTPDEVNMYVIDCGAETLKMFNSIPQVGEVATIEEPDLVYDIFEMLFNEMESRKELFTDYAGSYNEYINNSGKKLPLIITIINNYEIFTENFGKLSEGVQNIYRDGSKYGIMFIVSAISTNSIKSRMAQNFKNTICLQIPNETDYRYIVNAPRGLFPSKVFGRGLIAMNDTAYEFQTAIFAPKKDMTNVVRDASKKLNVAYTSRAKKVPTIPRVVTLDNYKDEVINMNSIPIGFDIRTKKVFKYNFKMPFIPILTGTMTMDRLYFINSIITELSGIEQSRIRIIDFIKCYESDENNNIVIYNDKFDEAIIKINNEVFQNKDTQEDYFYIFLGIGSLRNFISQQGQEVINNLFTNLSNVTNSHMIFIDTYDSYKNLQLEIWYQSCVNPLYGIWLGNEVANQLAINIPQLSMDDKKLDFPNMAFAVNNGNYNIIKHTTKMEEKNEE